MFAPLCYRDASYIYEVPRPLHRVLHCSCPENWLEGAAETLRSSAKVLKSLSSMHPPLYVVGNTEITIMG